jgi:hypothetical protein
VLIFETISANGPAIYDVPEGHVPKAKGCFEPAA